jgi:tetratricopeptide (TPR) repeat protein
MFDKHISICLLLATALTGSAQDKIQMTSGAVHEGAIFKVDAATVTFRMAAGDVAFRRTDIARVEIQRLPQVDGALQAVQTKKCAEAIPVLKAVTDRYLNLDVPWLQQAWAVLGDCQAATGQRAAATETYKKLLELYPLSSYALKARIGLGQGLASEKKYDEALALLEPVLQPLREQLLVSPADNYFLGQAMIVLGDCYQQKGELTKALDCYLSTVVLYYRDPEAVAEAQRKADELKEKLKASA